MNRSIPEITKESLQKDLEDFKKDGYKDRLEKLYRRLPQTKCKGCGACCYDTPSVMYPEFLLVMDYISNEWNKDKILNLYKKAIEGFMLGLVSKEIPCCFLEDNKCSIYPVSPISCKRWGLQDKKEYERDSFADKHDNMEYQRFYARLGVIIPEEVINHRLPYCDDVKIVKNNFNIQKGKDLENTIDNATTTMFKKYAFKSDICPLHGYIARYILGNEGIKDRVNVLKEYQKGNTNVVQEYIDKLNLEEFLL